MAENSLAKDLTGLKFGRWRVISRAERLDHGHRYWLCECECGNTKSLRGTMLTSGASESCGCLRNELTSARSKKHGATRSPTYVSWQSMRSRCNKSDDLHYPLYGGRGIKVCGRWDAFDNFLHDMGERPSNAHSIDRIDVNGDYTPDNCRWATAKEQGLNRRDTRWITYKGDTLSTKDMAEKYGIPRTTLRRRIDSGWSVERAVETPPDVSRKRK